MNYKRDTMVRALLEYELSFLIDNPECLTDICDFLAIGGFTRYTDTDLEQDYERLGEYYKERTLS